MASAADRRRAQRRLAKELKEGRYVRSVGPISARAAKKAREQPILISDPLKARVKAKKRALWDRLREYRAENSDSNVDESTAYEEMREFLDDFDDGTAREYASNAALARINITRYGDAGGLEIYLPFDFLFYH